MHDPVGFLVVCGACGVHIKRTESLCPHCWTRVSARTPGLVASLVAGIAMTGCLAQAEPAYGVADVGGTTSGFDDTINGSTGEAESGTGGSEFADTTGSNITGSDTSGSGSSDSSTSDSGTADSGTSDSGTSDSGTSDSGTAGSGSSTTGPE